MSRRGSRDRAAPIDADELVGALEAGALLFRETARLLAGTAGAIARSRVPPSASEVEEALRTGAVASDEAHRLILDTLQRLRGRAQSALH